MRRPLHYLLLQPAPVTHKPQHSHESSGPQDHHPSFYLSIPASIHLYSALYNPLYTFLRPRLSNYPPSLFSLSQALARHKQPHFFCPISTSIWHAHVYLSTSGHRSSSCTFPLCLIRFCPLYLPLLTSSQPPMNRRVIKFGTLTGSAATGGEKEKRGENFFFFFFFEGRRVGGEQKSSSDSATGAKSRAGCVNKWEEMRGRKSVNWGICHLVSWIIIWLTLNAYLFSVQAHMLPHKLEEKLKRKVKATRLSVRRQRICHSC